MHRHHLSLKPHVDSPLQDRCGHCPHFADGETEPHSENLRVILYSQGRVRAGIGTQGRHLQSPCLPPMLTGFQQSLDGESPPVYVVKQDSTVLVCGLTDKGVGVRPRVPRAPQSHMKNGTLAGETWAYGVLGWEAGNTSGSTRLKIGRMFWRVRRASARWRVVEYARPCRWSTGG